MPHHLSQEINIIEDKETMSPPTPLMESDRQGDFFPSSGFEVGSELDGRTQVIDDSGHVSKLVHQFYFIKSWPTDPDSISKIKKEESVIKKLNQDFPGINEKIIEKMSERDHLDYRLKWSLSYQYKEWRNRVARKGKILNDLYVALDELCFVNNALKGRSRKACLMGELDNHMLNSLMLHGRKSLVEEKQILRDINVRQRDVASFKSLEVLKRTIKWSPYMNNWQKLLREIEEFQSQWERAVGTVSEKGKVSSYETLKKAIKDQIKLFCDDSLENRRKGMALGTIIRRAEEELEAINQELDSLRAKLTEKHKKKGEAYQRILKLKNLYDGEINHYYEYCSLINKVHQLAEEKNVAALDELLHSEVDNFMLEWNNNKAFREDYEKKVLLSLERRQLSKDGRRRLDKSCRTMLL